MVAKTQISLETYWFKPGSGFSGASYRPSHVITICHDQELQLHN